MKYPGLEETNDAIGRERAGRIFPLAVLIAITFISGSSFGDDIYRIQRPDGRVEYTDKPPGVTTGVRRLPPAPETAGVVIVAPKVMEEADKRIKADIAEQNGRYEAIKAAEEKLRLAQKAKAESVEPGPGERQRLARGGSILNAAYDQRQDQLENDVNTAQAEVDAARGR